VGSAWHHLPALVLPHLLCCQLPPLPSLSTHINAIQTHHDTDKHHEGKFFIISMYFYLNLMTVDDEHNTGKGDAG
jgi:hypothetical protein